MSEIAVSGVQASGTSNEPQRQKERKEAQEEQVFERFRIPVAATCRVTPVPTPHEFLRNVT